MDSFTYEAQDRILELETYEWDNVWWEQAPDHTRPRILYIGDSISCGIRRTATACSGERILFDGFGTSKAVDNPYFQESLRIFGKQQGKREMVLFNNGLHGFHLGDTEGYKTHYETMVKFLLEEYRCTTVALVLTTYVAGPRNERVLARNSVVREIAEKYGLPVVDLYETALENKDMISDGVHFTAEGYEKLAEKLLEAVCGIVPDIIAEKSEGSDHAERLFDGEQT